MFIVRQSETFASWLRGLRDRAAQLRIAARLRVVEHGSLGDVKSVGDGVHELRVNVGPGYRLYFTWRGREMVLLLVGGDKATQAADIRQAKAMAAQLSDKEDT